MRRLKKNYYLTLFFCVVGILGLVRLFSGNDAQDAEMHTLALVQEESLSNTTDGSEKKNLPEGDERDKKESEDKTGNLQRTVVKNRDKTPHPIYSVPSFRKCFPDLQDTHASSARRIGVRPVENRASAEKRKDELTYIGSNPYYKIDPGMSSSIPFLVPRAAEVLETIARNYLDSLHVKAIPLHKLLVSSVLRTEEDVRRLRRINVNASPESCHRYGTTFDIPYNRYYTVSPPDETRRAVQNDTLKWVLAEVLRDVREQGMCYIKYEIKQGCFHITAR